MYGPCHTSFAPKGRHLHFANLSQNPVGGRIVNRASRAGIAEAYHCLECKRRRRERQGQGMTSD
jgi:hypothetical protein